MNDVSKHYDNLIDEGQDPVHDPKPLKEYMNKWDGQIFIDKMQLDKSKSVLEIGVGTGRIAVNVAPKCKDFTGIDISEKTIATAKKNIKSGLFKKPVLICADFLEYNFENKFDVVYSSLTFMHIQQKQKAFDIVSKILNPNGRFVLSIDKNRDEFIDMGTYKVKVYPDNVSDIKMYAKNAELKLLEEIETEFAFIFVFSK
ncbi:MAG: class I SAM-dependent methyltransferase [Clostridia bacterium]|nr:class I SAM-dependent methyltransferase [Clostridia bacterium]